MTDLQEVVSLVVAAGLTTGHADTHKELMEEVLRDVAELKLEIEADNRNAVDFINRIAELDREIVKLKENAKLLVRDLDDCQRAYDKAAGISNE